MKIESRHGYFIFEEETAGEIGRFSSVYGLELVSVEDYFTFDDLSEADEYSLIGKPFLDFPAIARFEGAPWEIMRANAVIYDIELGILKPVVSVISQISLQQSDFYYVSNSLIQPGSILNSGQRIVDFKCWYDWRVSTFKYTELGFL
jgi:hypothetical protein